MKRSNIKRKPRRRPVMPQAVADEVLARSGGGCEGISAELPGEVHFMSVVGGQGCDGQGQHLHHVKTIRRGGSDTADNLLHLSRACHDWVHAHPNEAAEMGSLKHSWD